MQNVIGTNFCVACKKYDCAQGDGRYYANVPNNYVKYSMIYENYLQGIF